MFIAIDTDVDLRGYLFRLYALYNVLALPTSVSLLSGQHMMPCSVSELLMYSYRFTVDLDLSKQGHRLICENQLSQNAKGFLHF